MSVNAVIIIIRLSPAAADASGVHAFTIVVDRGAGTIPSPVWRLARMPVEDAPGGGGRKTHVSFVEVLGREHADS